MKNLFILAALLVGFNLATFAAEPAQKPKIVRTLQTKTGKKIRTRNGAIAKVRQSHFHKSLG